MVLTTGITFIVVSLFDKNKVNQLDYEEDKVVND